MMRFVLIGLFVVISLIPHYSMPASAYERPLSPMDHQDENAQRKKERAEEFIRSIKRTIRLTQKKKISLLSTIEKKRIYFINNADEAIYARITYGGDSSLESSLKKKLSGYKREAVRGQEISTELQQQINFLMEQLKNKFPIVVVYSDIVNVGEEIPFDVPLHKDIPLRIRIWPISAIKEDSFDPEDIFNTPQKLAPLSLESLGVKPNHLPDIESLDLHIEAGGKMKIEQKLSPVKTKKSREIKEVRPEPSSSGLPGASLERSASPMEIELLRGIPNLYPRFERLYTLHKQWNRSADAAIESCTRMFSKSSPHLQYAISLHMLLKSLNVEIDELFRNMARNIKPKPEGGFTFEFYPRFDLEVMMNILESKMLEKKTIVLTILRECGP